MFVLTVVPVLMFVLLRQFIPHSITIYKLKRGDAKACPCLFLTRAVFSMLQDTLNICIVYYINNF